MTVPRDSEEKDQDPVLIRVKELQVRPQSFAGLGSGCDFAMPGSASKR